MTTPVRGQSGPGAQIPIAETTRCDSFVGLGALTLAAALTASIAAVTAAKPAAASVATIGTRVWRVISPLESTRPAATFVPPTSTPMKHGSETCINALCVESLAGHAEHGLVGSETPERLKEYTGELDRAYPCILKQWKEVSGPPANTFTLEGSNKGGL
jgi:hypothetical protein